MILAQTGKVSSADAMFLSLRRWIGYTTLSSPDMIGKPDVYLGYWLLGCIILLVAALFFQGVRSFLIEMLNWRGFSRVLAQSFRRVGQRPIVPLSLIGSLLLSWTTGQLISYARSGGMEDLQLTLRTKLVISLCLEQGALAAMTPLRDLTTLADIWPCLILGILAAYSFTNSLQWTPQSALNPGEQKANRLSQRFWIVCSFWLIYRMIVGASSESYLPLISGSMIEMILEPTAMIMVDGVLLSWIIVELRDAGLTEASAIRPRPVQVMALLPAIFFVLLIAMPGRYLAHLNWIVLNTLLIHFGLQSEIYLGAVNLFLWFFNQGLFIVQLLSLPLSFFVGAVAFSEGSIKKTLTVARLMLKLHGANLVFLLLLVGCLNLIATSLIQYALLSHPPEPWVLVASDSYTHYFTLCSGILLIAGFIEIASQAHVEYQLQSSQTVEPLGEETDSNPLFQLEED